MRGRLHHDWRRHGSALRGSWNLLGHPDWIGRADFANTSARVQNRRGARGPDRDRDRRTTEGALARRYSKPGICELYGLLSGGVRRSARSIARHGGGARPSDARPHADARLADEDVRHAADRATSRAASWRTREVLQEAGFSGEDIVGRVWTVFKGPRAHV